MTYSIRQTSSGSTGPVYVNVPPRGLVPAFGASLAASPMVFVGRDRMDYGEWVMESLLRLLENFSNTNPPPSAPQGALWFDTASGSLRLKTTSHLIADDVPNRSDWATVAIDGRTGTMRTLVVAPPLVGGTITTSGTISLPVLGGVVPGLYSLPTVTVDAFGRVTSISSSNASTGPSGVIAGSYSAANITIDDAGRITSASANTELPTDFYAFATDNDSGMARGVNQGDIHWRSNGFSLLRLETLQNVTYLSINGPDPDAYAQIHSDGGMHLVRTGDGATGNNLFGPYINLYRETPVPPDFQPAAQIMVSGDGKELMLTQWGADKSVRIAQNLAVNRNATVVGTLAADSVVFASDTNTGMIRGANQGEIYWLSDGQPHLRLERVRDETRDLNVLTLTGPDPDGMIQLFTDGAINLHRVGDGATGNNLLGPYINFYRFEPVPPNNISSARIIVSGDGSELMLQQFNSAHTVRVTQNLAVNGNATVSGAVISDVYQSSADPTTGMRFQSNGLINWRTRDMMTMYSQPNGLIVAPVDWSTTDGGVSLGHDGHIELIRRNTPNGVAGGPYIDFKMDHTSDWDIRIQQSSGTNAAPSELAIVHGPRLGGGNVPVRLRVDGRIEARHGADPVLFAHRPGVAAHGLMVASNGDGLLAQTNVAGDWVRTNIAFASRSDNALTNCFINANTTNAGNLHVAQNLSTRVGATGAVEAATFRARDSFLFWDSNQTRDTGFYQDNTGSQVDDGAIRILCNSDYVGAFIAGSPREPGFKGLRLQGGWVEALSFNQNSDRTLKEDIAPVTEALTKVRGMLGVTYTLRQTGAKQIGLIAQDVQRIIPEVVTDMGGTLGIQYGNLVGLLIEAIKELSAVVDEQRDTIHEFGARLSAIEGILAAGQKAVS